MNVRRSIQRPQLLPFSGVISTTISSTCAKHERPRGRPLTVRTKRPRGMLKHPATSVSELSRPSHLQSGYLFGQNSLGMEGRARENTSGLEEGTARRGSVSQISLLPPPAGRCGPREGSGCIRKARSDQERSEPPR